MSGTDEEDIIVGGAAHRCMGTARVSVTLEFDISGSWGPGATVDEIYRDAVRQADAKITDLWVKQRMSKIGEMVVRLVTYPVKK